MSNFAIASMCAYLCLLALTAQRGGRRIAIFIGMVLGLHTFASVQLTAQLAAYGPLVEMACWYAQAATFFYFARIGRARSASNVLRVLVSWPASFFAAGSILALPWAVSGALGLALPAPWLPLLLAGTGLVQSLVTRREVRRIELDRRDLGALARLRKSAVSNAASTPLRLVQISDPHLGAFMSEARLHRIATRAVREAPDLVLLTGDFLTFESQWTPEPLARALAPLAALEGRVFACFGNHDLECPELVRSALASARVHLLVDETAYVELPWGKVQIIGADHRFRERGPALSQLAARHPRLADHLRLWLLHDPGAFVHIPEGEADLVLSGHTHGGHLGLLSLGLEHTVVSAATNMPDHGLWSRGRDRLYVHRGTGHYGFPLRIGVPAEESVLEVRLV